MTTTQTDPSVETPDPPRPRDRRRWATVVAAACIVAVIAVGVGVAALGGDDSTDAAPAVTLTMAGGGDALASCLPVDAATLAAMPTAFAGTVTAVDDATVTLEVDRWYAGGSADTVTLQAADAHPALIAGFEFDAGAPYLVSATDGAVNFCGFSGPADPELTAVYEEAFPG